jgi:16S rRNA (guanine527-N7)-methyltransferase
VTTYGPEEFRRDTGVSRETLGRLTDYAALLTKWQKAVNLIGPKTVPDLWRRHMLDSAQLLALVDQPERCLWLDLGSGGGFPGLVVAIMGAGRVHLVEADRKKALFLREAARATDTAVTVHHCRIEKLDPFIADVVSARACAPLDRLLGYARPFMGEKSLGLFLKGQDVGFELTKATKCWKISAQTVISRSDPSGRIVKLKGCIREQS